MPKSKPPRKRLSRQVREEYAAAARERARARRQRIVAVVAVSLTVILGVFGVTALTGKSDTDEDVDTTNTTLAEDRNLPKCPPPEGSDSRKTVFESAPPTCIDPARKYAARMVTSAGVIVIEMDPEESPKAVNNFVFLSRWRFYDGLNFYKSVPNNYVQAGDPKGAGITGPGYFFADDPLPPKTPYQIGDVLVAHEAANQNGSQFLVLVGDGPQGTQLPPSFPRLGRVVKGIEVVQKIAADGAKEGAARIQHTIQRIEIVPLDE